MQCERESIARKQSSMPAAASEGTGDDAWKIVYVAGRRNDGERDHARLICFGPEVATSKSSLRATLVKR